MKYLREMTLREQQLVSLDILKDVHDFCEVKGIHYSLYGGTLLGAIRHNGFIPWDDDIDIIMPREDYDLFCSTYLSDKYHLLNRNTDSSCQLAYTRIYDKDKTICEDIIPCSKTKTGVWIDLFPADGCPRNENDIPSFYALNRKIYQDIMLVRSHMRNFAGLCHLKHNAYLLFKKIEDCLSGKRKRYISRLIRLNRRYVYGQSSYWASLSCPYDHVVYNPVNGFERCFLHKFEGQSFYIMEDYGGYLERVYGNYMELPPEERRCPNMAINYKFFWK